MNISYMWNTLTEQVYALLTGFGIGSNYDIYLTGMDRFGYFLDNTFLTMIYKVGLPVTLGYLFFIIKIFSKIDDRYLRYFIFSFLLIISVISYHFISNPGYLLTGLVLMNMFEQFKAVHPESGN
jgi:hypothetical protein